MAAAVSPPAHPARQRRAREINAITSVDLLLPVERQVIGVFGNEHMRQESRAWPSALDRQKRHRHLHDCLAGAAGELGSHMPDHLERGRHILQNFRDVFAKPAHL